MAQSETCLSEKKESEPMTDRTIARTEILNKVDTADGFDELIRITRPGGMISSW